MIKVYKIKVGEKVYEVEVESVTEVNGTISTPNAVPKSDTVVQNTQTTGGTEVEAPMQGLVVSIDVNPGDMVKAGDTLLVLEAMKMENPIVAPADGKVTSIMVKKGDTVDGGTIIATIS